MVKKLRCLDDIGFNRPVSRLHPRFEDTLLQGRVACVIYIHYGTAVPKNSCHFFLPLKGCLYHMSFLDGCKHRGRELSRREKAYLSGGGGETKEPYPVTPDLTYYYSKEGAKIGTTFVGLPTMVEVSFLLSIWQTTIFFQMNALGVMAFIYCRFSAHVTFLLVKVGLWRWGLRKYQGDHSSWSYGSMHTPTTCYRRGLFRGNTVIVFSNFGV